MTHIFQMPYVSKTIGSEPETGLNIRFLGTYVPRLMHPAPFMEPPGYRPSNPEIRDPRWPRR